MAKKKVATAQAKVKDYGILLSPVITEKSSSAGVSGQTVAFRVDPRASKDDIRGAVERVFSVKVDGIRTCRFIGKTKRTRKGTVRRAGFKKAYVTLKTGHKIELVEGL